MKLICETIDNSIHAISEEIDEATQQKNLYIEGIFVQAEKKNRNGRIYPKRILENAVATYVKEYVSASKALGELNHPQTPVVNPENAAILIKNLTWNDNDCYGKALVLDTPKGNIVRGLLNGGVKIGVSSRGLGSVKNENAVSVVEDDYTIQAIDVVSNPSGIDCWVDGILENTEFFYKNGILIEQEIDTAKQHIKEYDLENISEDFNRFLAKCLRKIS